MPVSLASRPAIGLPLTSGGSASASSVSRPARHSRAFRPAWSLNRPRRPFCQSASVHFVASMNRPGCYQPERQLLGGIRTHQREAPYHGALKIRLVEPFTKRSSHARSSGSHLAPLLTSSGFPDFSCLERFTHTCFHTDTIRSHCIATEAVLDKLTRSLRGAAEARAIGHGGIIRIVEATKMSRNTTYIGLVIRSRINGNACPLRVRVSGE